MSTLGLSNQLVLGPASMWPRESAVLGFAPLLVVESGDERREGSEGEIVAALERARVSRCGRAASRKNYVETSRVTVDGDLAV